MEFDKEMFDLFNDPQAVQAKAAALVQEVVGYEDDDESNKQLDRKITLLAYCATQSAPSPKDTLEDTVLKLFAIKGLVYTAYLHGRKDERDGKGLSDLLKDVEVGL